MMKRWIWLVLLLLIVAGGFFGLRTVQQSRQAARAENLQTVRASRGDLAAIVGATGRVRAQQSATLAFETSGIVEAVAVEVGDRVHAGERLAHLDRDSLPPQVILAEADLVAAEKAFEDLQNLELEQAQAQRALAQARDALEDAEYRWRVRQAGNRASGETIAATEANLVLAEQEVDRAEKEFNRYSGRPEDDPVRALARAKLAEARKKRDSILRNLNWYQGHPTDVEQSILDAEVALAEAELVEAQREWDRIKDGADADDVAAAKARIAAAKATLEGSEITAPFSGTIAKANLMPGDLVSPGHPVIQVADFSRLFVEVEVSEVDVNKLQVGQPVELSFDAVLDRTYHGEITAIGLTGSLEQGVVHFPVTVEVLDADDKIRPGLTAAVNIIVDEVEDALLVPNRAVRVRDGQRVVYVLRPQGPIPLPIELGASSDLDSEVVGGDLQEGDLIVLNPPSEFEGGGPPPFVGGGG
jgi:HlyD family secretion protein